MEKLRIIIPSLIAFVLSFIPAYGARERNYIYLFDVTASMKDYGLWEQAQSSLDRTLRNHAREAENTTHVIAFQDSAFRSIDFMAGDYLKKNGDIAMNDSISSFFNRKITSRHRHTDIVGALASGSRHIDPTRDNRIYLFTDGEDSRLGSAGVAAELEKWCGRYPNTRLFYIMLHKDAVDETIVTVAQMCRNIIVTGPVDGAIPEYVDIEPNTLYTSTLELDRGLTMSLSVDTPTEMKATTSDRFFDVEIDGGRATEGKMLLHVSARDRGAGINELSASIADECDSDGNYEFMISVESTTPGVHVLNSAVRVVVANKPLRAMEVLGGETEEMRLPGASSYAGFLFMGPSVPDTVRIPLSPRFNDAALASGVAQDFRITVPDGQRGDDFALHYNGREYRMGDVLRISTKDAAEEILVVFDREASTGKRYFGLMPAGTAGVERLNGVPVDEIRDNGGFSFRSTYSIGINPLKLALLILLAALAAALAVWFLIIKPTRYPRIKVSSLEIIGPDTYYKRVHMLGASRVVLTSRRRSQGLLSRLFTGKTVFVRAPHWDKDILIVPGNRKKVKVKCPSPWSCTPGFILSPGIEYTLNSPTGASSKLKI